MAGGAASLAQTPPAPAPSPTPPATRPSPAPTPAAPDGPAAQQPAPSATPQPAAPPAQRCTLDEPCVRADRQGAEKGRYWFEGFVDIRAGEVRIQADRVGIDDTEKPTGKTRILTATDNVVFLRDEERLAGAKLSIDLGTGKGSFEDAAGFIEPGVFIEGRRIDRLAPDTYRIEHGRFTSCAQPNPRWSFSAGTATIRRDDKITASNVVFKVKGVPAFYLPYVVYPIRDDQRATGLLFPHFGYSSLRGFNLGAGFFWALGRSFDQTLYADHYSRFGYGFGHEFRYALDAPSAGTFRSYAFRPKGGGGYEYDIDWDALQMLPGRTRASLKVRQYSDIFFQTQFQDSFNLATTRTKTTSLNLQKSVGSTVARVFAEANDTFFGLDSRTVRRRVPGAKLTRRARRVGRSPLVFAYDVRAELLERGDQDLTSSYSRLDLAPEASLPFGATFLQVAPSAGVRYTRYGASLEGAEAVGPALERRLFEANVKLTGPGFSKVFNTPGNFYSEKYKHVIEPQLNWRYRTRVDDFSTIPKFDGEDRLLGTNQLEYALEQRLLSKRAGPGGRGVAYEFLTWRVSQTYYVNVAEGQNEFDPNYSSAVFGPGGRPSHHSPILSSLSFKPAPQARGTFDVEYDVNFRQVRRLSLSADISSARAGLTATWSRLLRPAPGAQDELVPAANSLSGSASLKLVGNHLTLGGSANYDALKKTLLQTRAQARWDVQCCGFMVELIRYDLNQRQERQLRFAIELANVGSIGNFLGTDTSRQGLGSYR